MAACNGEQQQQVDQETVPAGEPIMLVSLSRRTYRLRISLADSSSTTPPPYIWDILISVVIQLKDGTYSL